MLYAFLIFALLVVALVAYLQTTFTPADAGRLWAPQHQASRSGCTTEPPEPVPRQAYASDWL